jgi:hypothetical protein
VYSDSESESESESGLSQLCEHDVTAEVVTAYPELRRGFRRRGSVAAADGA